MKRSISWTLVAALALAALPLFLGANAIDKLTTLFIFMLLAATWGLLAGQAGLVSVGQQAFFGLGAYFALRLVDGGWSAYPALFAGAVGAAVLPMPPWCMWCMARCPAQPERAMAASVARATVPVRRCRCVMGCLL